MLLLIYKTIITFGQEKTGGGRELDGCMLLIFNELEIFSGLPPGPGREMGTLAIFRRRNQRRTTSNAAKLGHSAAID